MPHARGKEQLQRVAESRTALPAFNVANLETALGVVRGAEAAGLPVILQVSPGAIAYAGYHTIRSICFQAAEAAAVPIVVHLDHCREVDVVRTAVRDGFTSVMFDGSRLPWEENVRLTREVVRSAATAGVLVEAELGYIGGSEDTTLAEARDSSTTPAQAAEYVAATGVDILAPAIGTLHRMPNDSVDLDIPLIASIRDASGVPLALHGGSGVSRSRLRAAIAAGVAKVNVSTRVSRSFADGVERGWAAEGRDDLRRYLGHGIAAVSALVAEYLELCGSPHAAGATPIEIASVQEPE